MKTKITVISLGPGSPEMMTLGAAEVLLKGERTILRTGRHPAASWLKDHHIPFETLDSFYSQYEDFDSMHQAMAAWLWQQAEASDLLFCVMDPGTDGAVAALRDAAPSGDRLVILPGISPADLCLASLPPELKFGSALELYSAAAFSAQTFIPASSLLITELDSSLLAGDVKLHLLEYFPDEHMVYFFPPDASAFRPVRKIPLYLLDSQKEYDHTSALFVPGACCLQRDRHTFDDLDQIVSRLRAPDGCPWDSIQTHESLRPYLVEEAWEAVDAIEQNDMAHLADELGDVLFQVMIHSSIGKSFDEFTINDVISGICRKMISRHPHVFGSAKADSAEAVASGWEQQKRAESGRKTVGETLDDVSAALPSLKYAIKMYKKLAQLPAMRRNPADIAGEIRELASRLLQGADLSEASMGQLLMKCTELCYRTDCDAEIILHQQVEQMKKQFQRAEAALIRDEKKPESLTFQQLCVYLSSVEKKK